METQQTTAQQREQFFRDHYVVYTATFIPQSKSRNAKEKTRTINWRVTIGRERFGEIETDYSQGIGHIPTFPQMHYNTLFGEPYLKKASEEGKYHVWSNNNFAAFAKPLPAPSLDDVMYSLVMDSNVLDSGGFEEWASEYGYDTDSRDAERLYKACLEIALKMRRVFGDEGLKTLRELFQDY